MPWLLNVLGAHHTGVTLLEPRKREICRLWRNESGAVGMPQFACILLLLSLPPLSTLPQVPLAWHPLRDVLPIPEEVIYFFWLLVSQGSRGDNFHFLWISTKGRFWGQVYVAGLMPMWAV